ncbi:MAG: selenium metabolism-associated LysR family transcriptional regulator [Anaerolineae bacterium]|nr:selenium metabolism-associated LysR family transcriptional regulator [Anaerolineae bacterium]
MIELRELRVFVAAAEEENFSAAARKLHLSQPAVSFQIQGLEQRLNVQLFQRNGRRITLTEAGRELLPLAREMVTLAARIEETMCAEQGIVKGNVVIGCSTSPGKYVLPHLIGAFRQKYPEAHFSVQVMTRQEVEEQLLAKQVHIGVLGLPAKSKDVECFPFFTDELILIAPVNHPWSARGIITPKELPQADWILRENSAATRQTITAVLKEHGIQVDTWRVAMELGSVEAIEAAVEAGHGVSFVSRVAVQRGLKLGKIKAIRVKGLQVQRQIYLARNKLRTCTCAQLKFREFIESPEGQKLIAQLTRP